MAATADRETAVDTVLADGLADAGIAHAGDVYWNLAIPQLVEFAAARGEGELAANGALTARTGKYTGRSPGDKFVVDYPSYHDTIWWGKVNQPLPPAKFEALRARVAAYLQGRELFVLDSAVGADPRYSVTVRTITELAWHNHFARLLFRDAKLGPQPHAKPDFTVIQAPFFLADPTVDGTKSETAIVLDLERRMIVICGTEYAGEIKKSIFTVMNYLLPLQGVFPMHCSASMGEHGDVALFFGLSGTGKTTLSTDPTRRLIGDDEHGWSDQGVFNIEGGSYAKMIHLSQQHEPLIWDAMRFGAVMENVVLDPLTRVPDYEDASLTENTRGAYPLDYIGGVVESGMGGHPAAVLLLTADASGVLPPISTLTPEQARYHFLSGYTSKLAGTERGLGAEPQATFSTCFAEPFLPLPPQTYSALLGERIKEHGSRCYLVNTGWTGGPYGVGHRMSLDYTRAMVRAALRGDLAEVEHVTDPVFGLRVPTRCPDVPAEILQPRATWEDKDRYDRQARALAQQFHQNFAKFAADVPAVVRDAGPRLG
ncbi:MAG TPA: phosphoenolpyruvate carboxykinase (ATP) [Thermomicrobiales bacterium]|nr:phosphoenolpyruvate carboxykinase (ATP) [Thermomicrobiales bacterium]